jgi:hypothetical protein
MQVRLLKSRLLSRSFGVMTGLLVTSLLLPAAAERGEGKKTGRQDWANEKVTDHGRIDWDKGVLYATGLGAVSNKEPNDAKAYLRARSFAIMDARRNMLAVVDHVKIDSRTTGADYEASSDVITQEIRGIVKGTQVVGERKIRIGNASMIEVTVATPMYGDRGIASVFLPEVAKRQEEPETLPDTAYRKEPKVQIVRPEVRAERPRPVVPGGDHYTGIIIDTRGLGVERSMSPLVRKTDGSEVWGRLDINLDFVIEKGIVGYARSLEEARENSRAGSNPLIIRAVGRAGGKFNSDAVVTDEDAVLLQAINAKGGILDKCNVIFVVDANK